MKIKSAWSRGLVYGGLGGAMAVFPVIGMLIGNAPLGEVLFGGGIVVLIWSGIGFLAGFSSHWEHRPDTPSNSVPANQPSLIQRLVYRFVAGLLLSYVAGMIVLGIGFAIYALWEAAHIGAGESENL